MSLSILNTSKISSTVATDFSL